MRLYECTAKLWQSFLAFKEVKSFITLLAYDMMFSNLIKSMSVVGTNEGVLLDLGHYVGLFGVF